MHIKHIFGVDLSKLYMTAVFITSHFFHAISKFFLNHFSRVRWELTMSNLFLINPSSPLNFERNEKLTISDFHRDHKQLLKWNSWHLWPSYALKQWSLYHSEKLLSSNWRNLYTWDHHDGSLWVPLLSTTY